MDAFFASVEQLDDPSLRSVPVLVGYDGPRGVVAAASYEARAFGCHSAQPMAVAKRLCPQARIVPVRGARYREVSERVFAIFEQYAPLVQPLSIDEAFLDVTGTQRLLGDAAEIAKAIKQRIRDELGLTASVGVAPNKFLSKLASDLSKPDGLKIVRPEEVESLLPPLPVGKLWGIGPKSAAKLAEIGVRTIADLRRMDDDFWRRRFGNDAERYRRLIYGQDDRPVTPDREAKSIGQEQTFEVDLADPQLVRAELLEQVEQVARRLRRHSLVARAVGLKIRFGEFRTITRSRTLEEPTDSTRRLWEASLGLFDAWASGEPGFVPVRLIGMQAAGLSSTGGEQMPLFPDPQDARQRQLDRTLDQITQRFGRSAIRRAGH